ncbi:unnamed protein product [Bathycoccus prasinos]
MRQKATEFKEHMGGKNITVLVGRSGAGKTHIVNKILNMSKPSDEEYQILNEYGNGKHESLEVYSIPDPENFFSEFTTNIFLRYSKLEMKHAILRKYFMASSEIASQLDGSFFLLPETELSTAAKVPSRIVYGSELRVTLVFDQAQTIQSLLDLLKDSIKNSRMEVENGTYFPTSFCSDRKTHSPDKSSMTGVLLRKALSILGLNANTNIKEIDFENEQFECSLHESLKQLKNDDGAHRCEPLQLLYTNDHLNEKIIEKCILLCSEFTKTTIQNLDQELSQFVLDTLIINLEYLPMVELFLKTTPVHFGDLEKIAGRTYSEICHKSWTRNKYETFFIELPKLIDSNFEENKELNDDMVWSFFFRENGVHIENGSEVDLDIRCHTKNASLSFSKVRDVEITGEFVQALKGVGISELDEDIQQATKFLISTQHFDGSWLQSEISDRKYHATVCAVGALLDHNYKYRRHSNNIIS